MGRVLAVVGLGARVRYLVAASLLVGLYWFLWPALSLSTMSGSPAAARKVGSQSWCWRISLPEIQRRGRRMLDMIAGRGQHDDTPANARIASTAAVTFTRRPTTPSERAGQSGARVTPGPTPSTAEAG
jgi:hypothetical protein